MKGLRNKVILSGIVLLFAFIATIGSTYAWFTVSSQTTIESMQLNVTAADNLLLRPATHGAEETLNYLQDASNYSTFITVQDLIAAGYLYDSYTGTYGEADFEGTGQWRLQPSTVLAPTTSRFSWLENVNNRTYSAASANDYNGQYILLDFWLLSQSETPQIIQLSNFSINSYEETSGDLGNTTEQEFVQNAVRLGVWLDDSDHGGTEATGEGDMYLFGNDTDYSFTFVEGMTGYDDTVAANNVAPSTTGFTVNTTTSTSDLYTVNFNVPTLVRVAIYIEGWDAQASNDIILATFQVAFGFKYKG